MKNLREHLYERLIVNKNYAVDDNLSFDSIAEAYSIAWYNFDSSFTVGKCNIDDIVMVNDSPDLIRYKISGTSPYFGFRDLQFRLIKEKNKSNILYYDGPKKRILIHPEDKTMLKRLETWVDSLEYGVIYSIVDILQIRLGIDNYDKFYTGKPSSRFKCYNGDKSIKALKKDLANTISKL